MNTADSERLSSALDQLGLAPTTSKEDADVVILNTCVVRQSAENKAVGTLTSLKPTKLKSPDKVFALMGCMVGPDTSKLKKQFPYVDVFMPPQQFKPLVDLLADRLGVDPEGCIGPLHAKPNVSTYIPIIHGCDKFCSFCIIPYRRGREVSRSIAEIVEEANKLVDRGVKEVTLLGQNVDSYGHDLPGHVNLANLLESVSNVHGIERIRFLTSHPNDMDDSIIEAVGQLDKVCENINLPFQAGDDEVLRNMRRGYTNKEYRELIDKIRSKIPNVTLNTDLIVGFCGETEEQFNRTLEMIDDIKFDKVHSAAYSTRVGTIADRKMVDDVPEETKKNRLLKINSLQESILTKINSKLIGKTQEILIEGTKNHTQFGRNRNDKIVFITKNGSKESLTPGKLINVKIEETSPWYLKGSAVELKSHQ